MPSAALYEPAIPFHVVCDLRPLLPLQTLFFVRLGADLVGRTVPRIPRCAITSQRALLAAAIMSVAATPLFFLYLRAPRRQQSDWLAIGVLPPCSCGAICFMCMCSRYRLHLPNTCNN